MIEYFILEEKSNSLIRVPTEQPGCWIALFEPSASISMKTTSLPLWTWKKFHVLNAMKTT